MNDRELYQQKKQAQLAEWKAEVDKLKTKASMARADAQLEMNKQIRALDSKIEESAGKLSALAKASEGAWESMKEVVESAWDSLRAIVDDAAETLKR